MPFRNLFFANLASADREALSPHLKPLAASKGDVLLEPGQRVEKVYFPIDAAVSLLVPLDSGREVEVASVGRDGVLGIGPALHENPSAEHAVVQSSGAILTCNAETLRSEARTSETLLSSLLQHEQRLSAHVQQMVACASSHTLEARMCRWLLRISDLTGRDELDFTQDQIAELLGVQRTFVSKEFSNLKQQGLVDNSRGSFVIKNADGLRRLSCDCYSKFQSISPLKD